jgi:hypothetical protein
VTSAAAAQSGHFVVIAACDAILIVTLTMRGGGRRMGFIPA